MLKKKLLLRKGMALLLTTVLSAGACIHTPLVVDSAAVNADSSVAEAEPDLQTIGDIPAQDDNADDSGTVQPTGAESKEIPAPSAAEIPAVTAPFAETVTPTVTENETVGDVLWQDSGDDYSVVITDISQRSVGGGSPRLDAPGTRNDTVPVTKPGDSNTPLSPDNGKENPVPAPQTDELTPYAPRITFGTGNGLYARWGSSELANEYYLIPGDTVTLTSANEPEGAKVYFTGLNSAIDAYRADPAFDFSAEDSGWTEYTDHVTVPFADHYARMGAVMTDSAGKAIKGTFVSTNFWELDCDRGIGVYGGEGSYNLRMTDYLNLSGAALIVHVVRWVGQD